MASDDLAEEFLTLFRRYMDKPEEITPTVMSSLCALAEDFALPVLVPEWETPIHTAMHSGNHPLFYALMKAKVAESVARTLFLKVMTMLNSVRDRLAPSIGNALWRLRYRQVLVAQLLLDACPHSVNNLVYLLREHGWEKPLGDCTNLLVYFVERERSRGITAEVVGSDGYSVLKDLISRNYLACRFRCKTGPFARRSFDQGPGKYLVTKDGPIEDGGYADWRPVDISKHEEAVTYIPDGKLVVAKEQYSAASFLRVLLQAGLSLDTAGVPFDTLWQCGHFQDLLVEHAERMRSSMDLVRPMLLDNPLMCDDVIGIIQGYVDGCLAFRQYAKEVQETLLKRFPDSVSAQKQSQSQSTRDNKSGCLIS